MRDAEDLVEVGFLAELVVGFIDCVEEVGEDYCGLDSSAMLLVAWCSWLRLLIAGTDDNTIVYRLDPA